MTLHPRLQPPTLEAPPKRSHSFALAMALTVLAAGFAYAMPKAMNTSATGDPTGGSLLSEVDPTGSTHTQTATPSPTPTATPTDDPDDDGDADGDGRKDNHGAAVSTAAHCDLHGRAHGEFVSSIARDKDVTVAEVEAACEAAKAAAAADAAAGTADKMKPARGHGKPDKAKLDDDDAAEVDDDDADDADPEPAETVPDNDGPDNDGATGGPPDHAKGNKNKP